ncbi:MAG: N-acetyltransferase [Cycloclasticus sp.]|nr:N-acetyltransferase [Cycloclasticus sp.]
MDVKFLQSINDISAADWNTLFNTDYPFIQHEFLFLLESSGCTQRATGWDPCHIIVSDNDQLIAAMPSYIKTHSYGEYVFDWAWANAYQQHGLNYYPKLLSAIPFTPATGPRLAFAKTVDGGEEKINIIRHIDQAIRDKFNSQSLSSWHLLFPDAELSSLLEQCQWEQRIGIQYHWFNRNYASFDNFLDSFKSRKRKTVRKEREAVAKQDISMRIVSDDNISKELMSKFYRFYHLTYLKRSGQQGYLNLRFFQLLLSKMSSNLVMICAIKDEVLIGAALCFKDSTTLYGRYWGCDQEYDFLHFEACYYQGIEYCIDTGLQRFDPGAQGEHKIPRGFEPTKTYSNHVILNKEFQQAINHFIQEERLQITAYSEQLSKSLPFKESHI